MAAVLFFTRLESSCHTAFFGLTFGRSWLGKDGELVVNLAPLCSPKARPTTVQTFRV